jgi:superfamily II DNA helicase RecQ
MSAIEEVDGICLQIILIITPLNSIMMDQCAQLCKRGVQACYLNFASSGGATYFTNDSMEDDYRTINTI